MPLTNTQRKVAQVLAPFRTRNNYVAGGAALNRKWPRLSDDMDIFHDLRDRLPNCVEPELQALRDEGFRVEITLKNELMVEAILRFHGDETKIQWFYDPETSKRFFPALADDEFGFRLHQADVAVNKVLCASRRREAPRDAVDLANIATRYAPLGSLVWAAIGKDPDLTPPRLIQEIRGIAFGYSKEEISAVRVEGEQVMTQANLRDVLGPALDQAHDYCIEVAPIDHVECLFVNAKDIPIEADDEAIANGTARAISITDFGITLITN